VALRIFDMSSINRSTYFEQELRLASNTDGRLDWYAVFILRRRYRYGFHGQAGRRYLLQRLLGRHLRVCSTTTMESPYAYYLYYLFWHLHLDPEPDRSMEDWNRTIGRFSGWATTSTSTIRSLIPSM
jgi:iron complex outermembrane receptor protein